MNYHSQFLKVTQQKLSDIRRRSVEKRDKNGRLLKLAVPVEFSLDQFREWVIAKFGSEDCAIPCSYGCGCWLDTVNFVPDHDIALDRGGRNTLENLRVSCSTCNDIKGAISGNWFARLQQFLNDMPADEAAIVRSRLQKSEKLANSVRRLRAKGATANHG